jgi:hypothetical protein
MSFTSTKQRHFEMGRQLRDAMHRVASEAVPEISETVGGLSPHQRVAIEAILHRRISEKLTAIAESA